MIRFRKKAFRSWGSRTHQRLPINRMNCLKKRKTRKDPPRCSLSILLPTLRAKFRARKRIRPQFQVFHKFLRVLHAKLISWIRRSKVSRDFQIIKDRSLLTRVKPRRRGSNSWKGWNLKSTKRCLSRRLFRSSLQCWTISSQISRRRRALSRSAFSPYSLLWVSSPCSRVLSTWPRSPS